MSYGADELREGILELFEEASERSRYFMAFEERETIQTVRRKFSSTHKVKDLRGLKAHAGSCPVCNARAREHRCPGW